MPFSIAVHDHPGSFSDRWAERARELGVRCALVDAHDTRILERLREHDALLWHVNHRVRGDMIAARHVIRGAEQLGLAVFPSTDTFWSFDDKIAQKYQLEALGAPMPRTDCFYSPESALAWLATAEIPVVMKLRGGAGSTNVRLVRSRPQAEDLVREAFGRGLKLGGILPSDAGLRLQRARVRRDIAGVLWRAPSTLLNHWRRVRDETRERGYVYFQEFLPGNTFDVRVTVVGRRAFAFTRNVRPNDFRASGSGSIDYSVERIPEECLRVAFRVAAALRSQSTAFDFALDREGKPRILETSFGYLASAVHACPGHWDDRLNYVEGHVWPQDAILEDLLAGLPASGKDHARTA